MSNSGKRFVLNHEGFELGDLVDSFGCEEDRPYMPGTGEIVAIRPDEERPYLCVHGEGLFYFKRTEIEHSEVD